MKKFRKTECYFYIWFAIIPFLCVLLDLLFSTIQPAPDYGTEVQKFDFSIINQSIYFSVWVSGATTIYGVINWIHFYKKNMTNWMVGQNNTTRITVLNVIAFVVYTFTLIFGQVIGFNTWYKILKSIFEHIFTPILVIFFFFVFKKETIKTKEYIKKYCWFNLLNISTYAIFILVRAYMLLNYLPSDQTPFTPWPYDQINPTVSGVPMMIVAIIIGISSAVLLGILFNYLSNLLDEKSKLWNNRKLNNNDKKQKK